MLSSVASLSSGGRFHGGPGAIKGSSHGPRSAGLRNWGGNAFFALVVGALLAVGLAAPNAAANPPADVVFSVTFDDVNPCTGLAHEVTLNAAIDERVNRNNTVLFVARTGSTSDGYVLRHGVEVVQSNKQFTIDVLNGQWRGPDGSQFLAHGRYKVDESTGEVLVDIIELRCIGSR